MPNERPWWAPDSQGFLAGGILLVTSLALFFRMASSNTVDDKMLDTMITILFSTCLVTVYNYTFGSSRGSSAKDDTTNKIVEKLTSTAPPGVPGPVAPVSSANAPWWSKLTDAEKTAITAAAATDVRVQAFVTASTVGSATKDDLAYLVAHTLLTQDRATAIAS